MTGPPDGSARRDVIIPAVWDDFYRESHIPAAVRVGDTLRLTGHTGEDADGVFPETIDGQMRGTFRNILITLEAGGMDWSNVVEVTSYHVGLSSQIAILQMVADEYVNDPYPAWTAVGVTELYLPNVLVEISCVAVDGGGLR